ncbi:hypothetical protein DL93DRAFT_2151664 [Clavulina sp. PMI_390]|nr:hypothetical protein DL93DRAFT_2151664 [Clavulina sp. PMI_390]
MVSVPNAARVVATVGTFGSLGVMAFYLLAIQQLPLGIERAVEPHCPASGGPGIGLGAYRQYTGVHGVDAYICMVINGFATILNPPLRDAMAPFILSVPTGWLIPVLEITSLFPNRRALVIVVPLIFGICAQVIGGGVCVPLFFAYSQVERMRRRTTGLPLSAPNEPITRGVILGIMLGATVNTIILVARPTFTTITLWQLLPVYLALLQLSVIPFYSAEPGPPPYASPRRSSLLLSLLLFTAAIPTLSHLAFVKSVLTSPAPLQALSDALIPYPYLYEYASVEEFMEFASFNEAKRFLQWDALLIYASTWLGGVWSWGFSSVKTFVRAVGISLVAGILLGPGALMAYPYLIQMQVDEAERQAWVEKGVEKKNQ